MEILGLMKANPFNPDKWDESNIKDEVVTPVKATLSTQTFYGWKEVCRVAFTHQLYAQHIVSISGKMNLNHEVTAM